MKCGGKPCKNHAHFWVWQHCVWALVKEKHYWWNGWKKIQNNREILTFFNISYGIFVARVDDF
jgi:hypothetical protein